MRFRLLILVVLFLGPIPGQSEQTPYGEGRVESVITPEGKIKFFFIPEEKPPARVEFEPWNPDFAVKHTVQAVRLTDKSNEFIGMVYGSAAKDRKFLSALENTGIEAIQWDSNMMMGMPLQSDTEPYLLYDDAGHLSGSYYKAAGTGAASSEISDKPLILWNELFGAVKKPTDPVSMDRPKGGIEIDAHRYLLNIGSDMLEKAKSTACQSNLKPNEIQVSAGVGKVFDVTLSWETKDLCR